MVVFPDSLSNIIRSVSAKAVGVFLSITHENPFFREKYKLQLISRLPDSTVIRVPYGIGLASNNKLSKSYSFKFFLFDYSDETIETSQKLLESEYGWIPVFVLQNGNTQIINTPFFGLAEEYEENVSQSFLVELKPRLNTIEEINDFI